MPWRVLLQRLFSTFANGLPGVGLMLQRLVTGGTVVWCVIAHFHGIAQYASVVMQLIVAGSALLLIVGLWTPIVGAIVAGRELWILFSGGGNFWLPLVLAILGATLAMIGPGAWSIDARLFGRKQLKPPSR